MNREPMLLRLGGRVRNISGISLIEMLIALLIITVGLLGMAGLQAYSLKNNTSAYHRSQANTLLYDLIDAMRSNRPAAIGGEYDVSLSSSGATGTRAGNDVSDWLRYLSIYLPGGDGTVGCVANADSTYATCVVTVRWDDTRSGRDCSDSGNDCQEMTVSTRI